MAYILKNNVRPSGSEVKNIKVGDTETKYIIRGDGALFYDIQMYIIYDVPNISFVYPDTITPAKGGSIKPIQQSFTQAWRRVGYSGNMYEQELIIEGATINYYIISGEGASVDENGEVTWESRDITFDENEREAIVLMTVTINGLENYAIATVKQAKNIIEKLELQNPTSGSISTPDIYPAKEDIKNIANIQSANSGCLVTFSSTESTIDYSNWVNLEIDYTWSTNKTYVSITPIDESCTARMFSRGTDYDTNNREAIVTRTATITASLKAGYINAESVSTIVDCYTTITQDPNTITITSITVTPGTISNPGLYPAKGDIKIVENKEESTAIGILTFDSEELVVANSTYGKWSGPNYFWESNQSYASCSGSGSFCSVEMDNRDTTVGDARSATITRNVNWTYTLSSNYGGDSSTEDHSALIVIWQEANEADVRSEITEYGIPSVSIGALYAYESETTVTYSVKNTKTYYYTSGAEGTSELISGSVTAEMTTNGNNRFTFTDPGLKHASMGTSATTDKVVIKVTNDDDTSKTSTASKSITNYTDASYGTPEITTYSYAVFPSTGGSKTPTVTYRQYSYYSSGSPCNVYTSGGTLEFTMSETAGFTLDSTTTGKITVTANTTTDTRSASPLVRVTMNGLTSDYYTTTRCILEGLAELYVIDDIYLYFSAAEDSESFTVTYSYYVGDSYVFSRVLSDYTITEISDIDGVFSRSGTTITAKANESTSSRSAIYLISASGYDDGYIYCYQDGNTVNYRTIDLSSGFSKTSPCPAEGGSCTVTAKVTNYWVSGDVTYDIPTLRSNNSALTVTKVNKSTYKATATWSANTGTSERSTTITASYSGASSETVTLYLEGSVSIVDELLIISSFTYSEIPPDGGSVTPTIGTVTYHVKYSDGSEDSLPIDKDLCSFTYSLDSTTNFTINTAGKVSSKSVNNSGMTRSAEVTCTCKWEGLTATLPTTVSLPSNYWWLTIVNNKFDGCDIIVANVLYVPLEHHSYILASVPFESAEVIDITNGLSIYNKNGTSTTLAEDGQMVAVWRKYYKNGKIEFLQIDNYLYYTQTNLTWTL